VTAASDASGEAVEASAGPLFSSVAPRAPIGRVERELLEVRTLAPYAMRSRDSRGRRWPEEPDPLRTHFQRDRDRIIHCTAFRRLEYKTQVFVFQEGDYYRTRLTHSLEAAQIARSLAIALGLQPDLVEAITLAHDLGHTPFGHAGQDAMQVLMAGFGGFEHNVQALRVVDLLERRYADFPGLNLTYEVRSSILKHGEAAAIDSFPDYRRDEAPLLEAEVADLADRIAYNHHDLDDGIKSGLFRVDDLHGLQLWDEVRRAVEERMPSAPERVKILQTINALIGRSVHDGIEETVSRLRTQGIQTIDDVRAPRRGRVVSFSKEFEARQRELQRFLHQAFYKHYRVSRMRRKAKRMLARLFQEYVRHPEQLPPEFQDWCREVGRERGVCDYLAGMTDRFAQDEYRKLFLPFTRA